jgi:hypothetical protein
VSAARRAERVPLPDLDHASVGSVKVRGCAGAFAVRSVFGPALDAPAH